jgi:hypothetical protein
MVSLMSLRCTAKTGNEISQCEVRTLRVAVLRSDELVAEARNISETQMEGRSSV